MDAPFSHLIGFAPRSMSIVARHARMTAACIGLTLTLDAPALAADSWTGQDKGLHFVGSAAMSMLVTGISQDAALGFWSSVAVGAAKEVADRNGRGDPSVRDFMVDVAGAYLGTQTGVWRLYRDDKTIGIMRTWKF